MEQILFNATEYNRLYNCTMYRIEDIPFGERQRPILGTLVFCMFLVFELLYIPVMWAMRRHLKQSCYKLMFCLGLIDMPALVVLALLSGIFAFQGAGFCSYPMLNIWAGFIGMFFWFCETHMAIVLAANRLLSQACPWLCELLFRGARTWCWALGVALYSLLFAWTELPLVWSSYTFSWFFNPHIGYVQGLDHLYENKWDAMECVVVAFSMPIIYLVYFFLLMRENGRDISDEMDRALTKIIFFQAFLVCMINSMEATIYLAMETFPTIVTPQLITGGTFCWISIHGMPPVIYLAVNKTLRRECKALLSQKFFNKSRVSNISGANNQHQGFTVHNAQATAAAIAAADSKI